MADQDPWAEFEPVESSGTSDPWAEFHPAESGETSGTGMTWGYPQSIESGMMGGHGPEVAAAGYALRHTPLTSYLPGQHFVSTGPGQIADTSFGAKYREGLGIIEGQRADYRGQHPLLEPSLELAGSVVPTVAANELTPGLGQLATRGALGQVASLGIRGAEMGGIQTGVTGGDPLSNEITGAGLNIVLPGASSAVARLIAPQVNPLVAQTVRSAEGLGVKLRPGQFAMSTTLKKLDQTLASGGDTQQLKDFTRSFSHVVGEDTDALTGTVIDNAFDRVGQGLNAAAANSRALYDPALHGDLTSIGTRVSGAAGMAPADRKAVADVIADIQKSASSGTISGDDFQSLTKRGSMLSDLSKSGNADVRRAGGDIVDSLFNALDRHSPPGAVDEIRNLRDQFKYLNLAEKLALKAGPSGIINPKDLVAEIKSGRLTGDAATLAEAGRYMPQASATGAAKPQYAHYGPLARLGTAAAAGGAGFEAMHELGLANDPKALAIALGAAGGALALRTAGRGVLRSDVLRNVALGLPPPNWATGLAMAGRPLAIGAVNSLGGQRTGE